MRKNVYHYWNEITGEEGCTLDQSYAVEQGNCRKATLSEVYEEISVYGEDGIFPGEIALQEGTFCWTENDEECDYIKVNEKLNIA
jgi:hypothetical protein